MQQRINDEKNVLKAAQAVWATNKYFTLACNQKDYYSIREFLKPNHLKLNDTYKLLKHLNAKFQAVHSEDLPQISNALFHMLGYFKKKLPDSKRQELNQLIKDNPKKALLELERYSSFYKVTYLAQSNIWSSQRTQPFNQVNIPITDNGVTYSPNELLWMGDYLMINKTQQKL